MRRAHVEICFLVLCVTPLVAKATPAFGTDLPIAGTVSVVKHGKLAKFVSKSAADFALPSPGSPEDPTVSGALLRFFDTVPSAGGQIALMLDSSGWEGLGDPAGSDGYKYKGKDDLTDPDPNGTCRSVLLKAKVIKAICKGARVSLTTPFSGTEGITLGLPAASASLQYCAEFGGNAVKNDAKLMKRKDAPAPSACSTLPPAFNPNDVIQLADDSMQGRNNNTAGSVMAQDFLIAQLKSIAVGLNSSQTGTDAFKQPFSAGTNVLALIPGGELASEYVIVGAHYDHLGSACTSLTPGDFICNGATDNAAGVAAALAVGRAIHNLPTPPRRSVVLAFWDSEEDGLAGSAHYVANPLVPLANTIAYVNFDIQGANLLPSAKAFSFAIAAETGGAALQAVVDDAILGEGLDTRQLSIIFGQGRSDYVNFVNAGIPSVFFSDATGPCYHTTADDVGVVDFGKLEKQSGIAFKLARSLLETSTPPAFAPPSPSPATFADAVALNDVVNAGIADLSLFSPADQVTLLQVQTNFSAIVAAGAGNFDAGDVATLLVGALDLLNALSRISCDGFL